MREGFAGFAVLDLPAARVVLAQRRFPRFLGATITVAQSPVHVVGLGPASFPLVVEGGVLLTTSAAADAAVQVALRIGGTTVGGAQFDTDIASTAIPANSPGYFRVVAWPGYDGQRLHTVGCSWGGLVSYAALAASTVLSRTSVVSTANVQGAIEIAIIALTATSGAFTLDWLQVTEYPDPERILG